MKRALPIGVSVALVAGIAVMQATDAPVAPRAVHPSFPGDASGRLDDGVAAAAAGSKTASPQRPPRTANGGAPSFHAVFLIGADGGLVVDLVARERIDSLIAETSTGEEAEARIVQGLTEAQARQARSVLAAYRAYLQAEADLLAAPRRREDAAAAQALEDRLVALRRFHLGEAVALAFFGAQERRTRMAIEAVKARAHEGG